MRERHNYIVKFARRDRITPAYAGKTYGIELEIDDGEDHPRVCGKDKNLLNLPKNCLGSPPRMRERPV